MGDLEKLVAGADAEGVRLRAPATDAESQPEVLFDAVQLPLVALTALACLSLKGPPSLPVSDVGLRVAAALMLAFPKFERVGRRLQWSLRVRAISADAIVFLEQMGLAEVRPMRRGRSLAMTTRGRELVKKLRRDHGEIGRLMNELRTAARSTRGEELRLI